MQYVQQKVLFGLKNTEQNERYVSGVFDNEEKIRTIVLSGRVKYVKLVEFLAWKLTEEIPYDDAGVNCVRVITYSKSWIGAWPYVTTIADTVMLNDSTIRALRPFQSRNICLLKDHFAIGSALVTSNPEV